MTPLPPLPAGFDRLVEFPILYRWLFLNHAGVSPISARAQKVISEYAQEAAHDAYLTGRWYQRAEHVRELSAKLINAEREEIAFVKNTSEGLAFVANGLTWQTGEQIITTNVEYPANVYPWLDLQQRFGVELIRVAEKNGVIDAEDLFAAVTPRTRMMALSHVEYASGFRHDLVRIGKFCRDKNLLLCVDAIQSAGVWPIDVRAMNIDFLSADGHKWLLGPEGAGIFYCRRELIPSVHPEVGWMNVVDALDFGHIDFTLRNDAKRFECGSYNIPGILALGASLELIDEVTLDVISRRVLGLTDYLVAGLKAKGYEVFSPRGEAKMCSGIVSFNAPQSEDNQSIFKDLEKRRIVIALREGRLRVAPHFYNTIEQMDEFLNALPG